MVEGRGAALAEAAGAPASAGEEAEALYKILKHASGEHLRTR